VLAGIKEFTRRTAQTDGSFRPGVDPNYGGHLFPVVATEGEPKE
jgi:hypothetical protein